MSYCWMILFDGFAVVCGDFCIILIITMMSFLWHHYSMLIIYTPPETNLDTQNDGLEKVTPFKNGNFWYLC